MSEENHLREELLFWRCEHHIVAAERDRLRTRLEQAEKERDGYIQKSDDLNRVVMKRGKQIDELVEALRKFAPASDGAHEFVLTPAETREVKDALAALEAEQ